MPTAQQLLNKAAAAEAIGVVREVAERLRDPAQLADGIERAERQAEAWPGYGAWQPVAFSQGNSGLALAFGQLGACFPAEGWGEAAHRQLGLAVDGLRQERTAPTGLFVGLAGLAFAADQLDRDRYAKLLSTLNSLVTRRTEVVLTRIAERRGGCAEHDLDVVSGLAGVGRYFLTRGDEAALRPILERLSGLILAEGPVPAWYAPAELLDADSRVESPGGRLNCGLAHGLPGPLALLALAHGAGMIVDGLADAIRRASDWLVEVAVEDEWGMNWPHLVPVGAGGAGERPGRAAWCYGAPGVSRALWLAGTSVGEAELQQVAVSALEAVYRRPRERLQMDSATFCHGVAGVLQITLRMAADSGSERLRASAAGLAEELVGRFEPDSAFGYRDLDPGGGAIDQAGLLQGAAGVVLALLAAATPEPPRWDCAFLLS